MNRTEHRTMVSPVDVANVSEPGEAHDFEGLSPEAKSVFLETRNASGSVETKYTPDERPSEFGYYDDTGATDYVHYEGAYYEVVTSRADCLGFFCYLPHLRLGAISVAGAALVGYGLWRVVRAKRE